MSTLLFSKKKSYSEEIKTHPWIIIFIAVLAIRMVLSFFGPWFSTDLLRNLFYGQAFWKHGFNVYSLSPLQINPNYSIIDPSTGRLAYPNTAYDYPSVEILFWAVLALFPASNILAKWVLLFIDCINFFLLRSFFLESDYSYEKTIIPWFYFLLMVIISTIEGQAEGITIFFMLAALKFLADKPLVSYLLVAIGAQWKYIPLICLPYIIYKTYTNRKILYQGLGIFIITSIILASPLLVSPYILRYISYGGNLPNNQLDSNPMAWKYLSLSSIILWAILVLFIYFLYHHPQEILPSSLVLVILIFLKYYRYAFPWYWIWVLPGMVLIEPKFRQKLWISFLILIPVAIFDFVSLTAGWNYVFNFVFQSFH